jgi:hypothetical protein
MATRIQQAYPQITPTFAVTAPDSLPTEKLRHVVVELNVASWSRLTSASSRMEALR